MTESDTSISLLRNLPSLMEGLIDAGGTLSTDYKSVFFGPVSRRLYFVAGKAKLPATFVSEYGKMRPCKMEEASKIIGQNSSLG